MPRKSNAVKEAEVIISVLQETGTTKRILNRQHIPIEDREDIEQNLYMGWLENPDGLLKAQVGGYLVQYVTNACRNSVSNFRRRKEMCMLDSELDKVVLYEDD